MSKKEFLELRHAIECTGEGIVLAILLGVWFLSTEGWAIAAFTLFVLWFFSAAHQQQRRRKVIDAQTNAPSDGLPTLDQQ